MRWLSLLFSCLIVLLPACGERQALPFPTPAQRDLVVLTESGPLTYQVEENGSISGLEYDLIETFAKELGVGVHYIVATPDEIRTRLNKGEAHFAAAWLSRQDDDVASTAHRQSSDILLQSEASLPIDELAELAGRTVHVVAGSRQAATLQGIKAGGVALEIVEHKEVSAFDLIEQAEDEKIPLLVVDSAIFDIAQQFAPSLVTSMTLGEARPISWIFPPRHNSELLSRANAFIGHIQTDGTLARLEDRYFGHIRRLKQADILKFLEKVETVLPKLRKHFLQAQTASDVDWRLIAAVAYHESNWDANAVSPTGVRGIMMLTEETADRLGVSNRLDARESIVAGARYIDFLRSQMPATATEPDRTWLALAAYNIGPGHFNAARTLARQFKADSASWYEMKRILPLLAQPPHFQKLKSGRARGGEAVIMVENIRSYYDILQRNEPAYRPVPALGENMSGMIGSSLKPGQGPGLKRKPN